MKSKLMMKLALAVVVAVVATVGQAADTWKLNWNVGLLTGNYNMSAYFFLASDDGSAFSGMKTTTISDVIKAYNAATDKSSSGIFDATTYIKMEAIGGYSDGHYEAYKSVDSSASAESILKASFFALVADPQNDRYMIATTSEGKQTITPTLNTNYNRYDWNWGTQTADSWLANGTVPEPTSGVLLLVGVAALALKRNRYRVVA